MNARLAALVAVAALMAALALNAQEGRPIPAAPRPEIPHDPSAAGPNGVNARLDLLFGEHDPYRTFFHDLQGAVAENAPERVAAMVSYPLKVRINGHAVHLRSAQQFVARYDELLPPKTRDVLTRQAFDNLFVNNQGVMIGNGQIWFSGVCKDQLCSARPVKITALNP